MTLPDNAADDDDADTDADDEDNLYDNFVPSPPNSHLFHSD